VIEKLRVRLTYANTLATLSLFIALGGTSFAVIHVGSREVVNNSLRSQDIRNNTLRGHDVRDRTLRARDLRRNSLGSGAIKETAIGTVPKAADADRLGGVALEDLRLHCPTDTVSRGGVCIERSARAPDGFLGASDVCDAAGRALVTMPQLDRFARVNGPLPAQEWTASVYRNPANGPTSIEQLEAVVLGTGGEPSYDRVYLAVQHAFRCVALPSN
jgi:hypothetical protein